MQKLMEEVTSDPLFTGPKFTLASDIFRYIYSPQFPVDPLEKYDEFNHS